MLEILIQVISNETYMSNIMQELIVQTISGLIKLPVEETGY